MKLPFMRKTWDKSRSDNAMLMTSNIVLAFIAAAAVYHTLSIEPVTRLVPPNLDRPMIVGANSADENYLKSWGLYFVTLVGNITPGNAKFVADSLSAFVDSNIYPEIRKKIYALANDPVFRNAAGASRFVPGAVNFEPATSTVFVRGQMVVDSAGNKQPDASPITYALAIAIRDGRPWIIDVDSYEGMEPHTLKWKAAHPPAANKEQGANGNNLQSPEYVQ